MPKCSWSKDFLFEGTIKEFELRLPAVESRDEVKLEDVGTIDELWLQLCRDERLLGVFVVCDDSLLMCIF